MRLSRRLSGLYKPILLIASACAFAYLLLADPDNSESGAHSKKSKHHKKHHDTGDDYEVGAREEFPGFEGTIMGRGLNEDVPKEIYRDSGKLGNYEPDQATIKEMETGTGDYGKQVNWGKDEEDAVRKSIKEFGFNMVMSDKISLDRVPKDIRDPKCKYVDYPEKLPEVSIVIVFHNEGWSTLMRTVHSVIKQTPKELLGEVVMVDDASTKEHLKDNLDEYVKRWNGLVRVHRNGQREGLIRARSIGAMQSTKEVLVFLDAHCEAEFNWLPPLLAPIARNDRISTVPMIDGIDGNHYHFTTQGGGDRWGRATGAWDWSFLWKRIALPEPEDKKLPSKIQPFPSPAMAGGLFAINRQYFKDIMYYDPGLEIWGGENFELSYKLWMCGGGMLFVPCSRVGHIYRLEGWDGNPPPKSLKDNPSMRNYRRVIETWWDDWSKYFYVSRPEAKTLDFGDISAQLEFRKNHCPYDFNWFMKEIGYGVAVEYPTPPLNKFWGEVRARQGNQCLDSMGHTNGGSVETYYCHKQGGNQLFRLNEGLQLMQYDQCLFMSGSQLKLSHCSAGDKAGWDYDPKTGLISYGEKKKQRFCISLTSKTAISKVKFVECDANDENQLFDFNEIHSV